MSDFSKLLLTNGMLINARNFKEVANEFWQKYRQIRRLFQV